MTPLHLVLIDPPSGAAERLLPWLHRAGVPSGGGRMTVHADAQAFLREPAGPAAATDGAPGPEAHWLFCTGADGGADALIETLRRVAAVRPDGLPGPVAVLGPPLDGDAHAMLVEAGAQAWGDIGTVDEAALRALLDRAAARWRREHALRSELVRLRTRMDERQWVDKAKGLLMLARGMAEDEAFALLRSTAMHANLRLGEVSRAVIDAARWAGSVNRAGQLRMLSQRFARLAAQARAGIEPVRSLDQHRAVAARIDDNLGQLARLPAQPDCDAALARVRAARDGLVAAWPPRAAPRDLAAIDAAAEALLEGAEVLAETLQVAGGRRALRIVNLCGRQRMLAERIAKSALLAAAGIATDAALLPAAAQAFETALAELEQAPLTSPEVRAALAEARAEWLRLARSLQNLGRPQGGVALARSVEALVDTFDRLAAQYEHSLQVLLA